MKDFRHGVAKLRQGPKCRGSSYRWTRGGISLSPASNPQGNCHCHL